MSITWGLIGGVVGGWIAHQLVAAWEDERAGWPWLALVAGMLTVLLSGCGGGVSVTGPSEPQTAQAPVSAPLRAPDRLRLVWGTVDTAGGPVARFGANAVALQIGTWGENVTPFARWARERGIVVLPFVEQVFTTSDWPYYWAKVEKWARPLEAEGVLVGWHVTDEWAYRGLPQAKRDEAVAFVRSRSPLEVMHTEWVDIALHRDFRKPAGRWFGVNCYAYASRTPWHTKGCVETFERHPEWNLVVVPAFAGGNMAGPYDQAAWEGMADRTGKSIAFWSWEQ